MIYSYADSPGATTTLMPLVSDWPTTFNAWHWYKPASSSWSRRTRNLDLLLVTRHQFTATNLSNK